MKTVDDVIIQIERRYLWCDGLCFFCHPVLCDMEAIAIDMILEGCYYG